MKTENGKRKGENGLAEFDERRHIKVFQSSEYSEHSESSEYSDYSDSSPKPTTKPQKYYHGKIQRKFIFMKILVEYIKHINLI